MDLLILILIGLKMFHENIVLITEFFEPLEFALEVQGSARRPHLLLSPLVILSRLRRAAHSHGHQKNWKLLLYSPTRPFLLELFLMFPKVSVFLTSPPPNKS